MQALTAYAAKDFGDFGPADAFVNVLMDIGIAPRAARRSGATFGEEAEAIITDFEDTCAPRVDPLHEAALRPVTQDRGSGT